MELATVIAVTAPPISIIINKVERSNASSGGWHSVNAWFKSHSSEKFVVLTFVASDNLAPTGSNLDLGAVSVTDSTYGSFD